MSTEGEHDPQQGHRPNRRFVLNPSGKLLSRIIPWHVGLAIIEPISRLAEPPKRLIEPYVKKGQTVADLGCGRGYYTLALAELVGPAGKVYAVDLDKKNIRAVQKRAAKGNYHNIEAHTSFASDLSFIKDRSIDFILANGLLWSMAHDRQLAVNEMKRILKPNGQEYITLGGGPPFGYVEEGEWEKILEGFTVQRGGGYKEKWAVVSLRM